MRIAVDLEPLQRDEHGSAGQRLQRVVDAILRHRSGSDSLVLVLDGSVPSSFDRIRAAFEDRLGADDRIASWQDFLASPVPGRDPRLARIREALRRGFRASLHADRWIDADSLEDAPLGEDPALAAWLESRDDKRATGEHATDGRSIALQAARREAARLSLGDRVRVAKAIAETFDAGPGGRLWVDISTLVRNDHRTGIQRVVRAIASALLRQSPGSTRLVYGGDGRSFVAANEYMAGIAGADAPARDEAVAFASGDVLLMLDLSPAVALRHEAHLQYLRNRGVRVVHVVYDLLPIDLPRYFWPELCAEFAKWLRLVSRSDGAVAISRDVAARLQAHIARHGAPRPLPVRIGHFRLGSDIGNSMPTRGLPADASELLSALSGRTVFLMVGTIEPRKGHRQVLAAFETLWARGRAIDLVVVGRMGWGMTDTATQWRSHAQARRRLHWIDAASDEYLERLYAASDALIAASEGEGFGLPLVEAARHGLKIIARDLPVFREVAGEHAHYFADDGDPARLADSIDAWLLLEARGEAPASSGIESVDWAASAAELRRLVFSREWTHRVFGGGPKVASG